MSVHHNIIQIFKEYVNPVLRFTFNETNILRVVMNVTNLNALDALKIIF